MKSSAIKYSQGGSLSPSGIEGVFAKAVKLNGPFSGRPEAHENQHDLYVVISGEARVRTGEFSGEIEQVGAGEFRCDEMISLEEFRLQGGDCLLIPAGLAHMVLVDSGEYVQWVFKIECCS